MLSRDEVAAQLSGNEFREYLERSALFPPSRLLARLKSGSDVRHRMPDTLLLVLSVEAGLREVCCCCLHACRLSYLLLALADQKFLVFTMVQS